MSNPDPAPRRPQLSDEAESYVRDQITSGTWTPGSRVRPESVAADLEISPTPAREALQALRAEGLLDHSPRRGFTVARITGSDVRDLFMIQAMIAGELAARAAAQASDAALAEMAAIHERLSAAVRAGNVEAVEELNHRFHRLVNISAESPRMARILTVTFRYAPRRFYASIPGWLQTTIDDHEGILEALLARDIEAVRLRMRAHIERSGELLAQHVDARLASAEPGTSRAAVVRAVSTSPDDRGDVP